MIVHSYQRVFAYALLLQNTPLYETLPFSYRIVYIINSSNYGVVNRPSRYNAAFIHAILKSHRFSALYLRDGMDNNNYDKLY